MLEETANVVNADANYMWLQVDKQSACGKCSANKGCGTSILANFFNRKPRQIKLPNTHNVKTGDQVLIGLSENAIMKGSLYVYLLPVLGMLFGALTGQFIAGTESSTGELFSIILGITGLFAGSSWARYMLSTPHNFKTFKPVLIRVL